MTPLHFSSNQIVHRFRLTFVFGLQTYHLIDFSKIYQLKGLEPKNKGKTNSYEQFDLTKNMSSLLVPFHNNIDPKKTI